MRTRATTKAAVDEEQARRHQVVDDVGSQIVNAIGVSVLSVDTHQTIPQSVERRIEAPCAFDRQPGEEDKLSRCLEPCHDVTEPPAVVK